MIFNVMNVFPFPVTIKILGKAPEFPKQCNAPVPGGMVAIPYPDPAMRIQIRKPFGDWSPVFTLKWAPGILSLPKF